MNIIAIILNFNSAVSTGKLIENIKQNSKANVSIIVVDNNSSSKDSETLHDIVSDSSVELIELSRNIGYAAGNNIGITAALKQNPDFIFIMNPDIHFEDDVVDKVVRCFKRQPKLALCSPVQKIGIDQFSFGVRVKLGKSSCIVPDIRSHFVESDSVVFVDGIVGSCMCVRVSAINQFGQIPEEYFLNFEETDWCMSCRLKGFKVGVALNTKIFHAVHGSISAVGGLQDYYMRRNAVVFNIKYLSTWKKILFIAKSICLEVLRSVRHFKRPIIRPIIDGVTGNDMFGNYVGKKEEDDFV